MRGEGLGPVGFGIVRDHLFDHQLDINMLALLGGGQRSRQQYAALLDRAGFEFRRQIYTRAGVAILESFAV